MSDYSEDFEKDFFPNTKVEHVELNILDDMLEALRSEIAKNGWPVEEGLRYILAAGLAALRAERERKEQAEKPEVDLRAEIDRLQRQRMQIDGRYAVMKYRAYQSLQDAKTLTMKLNVYQMQLDGLRLVNEQLRLQLEGKA